MDKRNSKKGLVIIGAEVQGSSDDAIKAIIKEHKIKFTITKGVSGPPTGGGIPHAVVFDATGKVVFKGHPADGKFEKSIKTALKELKKNGGVPEDEPKSSLPEKKKPLIAKRTWTNDEGKKIIASVLSADDTHVEFKLANGKKVKYPVAKLSESDQELIKESSPTQE